MKNLLTPLVGAASLTALSLAFSAPAEAVLVNVGGTDYDLGTYTGSYNDNIANACPSESCLTTTPWWGNNALATQLATALAGVSIPGGGLPGNDGGTSGPYFAWGFSSGNVQTVVYNTTFSGVVGVPRNPATTFNYAVPVPLESDALPVVGAAAFMAGGLWWKKKRAGAKALDLSPTESVKG
ncbi:MAG: hypothetical protein ACK5CA_05235 [Cyanobacteriota bacterium]|jgi:hypothetical protein